MPNRIIKESVCTSDTIDGLSADEERLFYRLIVNCDDFGLMDARPQIILGKCFPLKIGIFTIKQIEKWLKGLINAGLVFTYNNNKNLKIATWEHHQQIRAKRAKYPLPEDNISCNQLISDDCNSPRNPIQSESKSESESESERAQARGKRESKVQFAEFVSLTNVEYSSLVAEHGEHGAKRMIEILDNYKGSNGKKYKSDYRAILNWVVDRYKDECKKGQPVKGSQGMDMINSVLEDFENGQSVSS